MKNKHKRIYEQDDKINDGKEQVKFHSIKSPEKKAATRLRRVYVFQYVEVSI
jgi:hypothetical protein